MAKITVSLNVMLLICTSHCRLVEDLNLCRMAYKTRSSDQIGICAKFKINKFPTEWEVLTHLLYLCGFNEKSLKVPSDKKIETADDIINIWKITSIPTIIQKSVVRRVESLYQDYRVINKNHSRYDFSEKFSKYRNKLESQLFDIAVCKCIDNCKCSYEFKVPPKEREFLADQRDKRQMVLLPKARMKKNTHLVENTSNKSASTSPQPRRKRESNNDTVRKSRDRDDNNTKAENIPLIISKRVTLSNVVREAQRHNISSRKTADIVNAFVKDVGLQDSLNIIDRNKIIRETSKQTVLCEKEHLINIKESLKHKQCFGVYFDGKKDITNVFEHNADTAQNHLRTQKEDHHAIVLQPNDLYYTHVTTEIGKGKNIAEAIYEKMKKDGFDLETLMFFGCDGTNTNTGHNSGIRCKFYRMAFIINDCIYNLGAIVWFERIIGHAGHWSVCLLHFNELPLKTLFVHLDGVTIGPKLFGGTIGKMLTSCEKRPIKEFDRVFSDDLPVWTDSAVKQLSIDQRYLYEMCHAIQNGFINSSLAMKSPGTLVHSRFLTTANRILRYYVSKSAPSQKLVNMVDFIIKVYAPMWFAIKSTKSFRMGSLLIYRYIKMIRENIEPKFHDVLFKVVSNNSYFAHPENVLITMLTDENKEIREMAVESILKAKKNKSDENIRKYQKPRINFDATTYFKMVNYSGVDPPITQNSSIEEVKACIENADNWIKMHTQ